MENQPSKILITTSRNPTQTIRTFCNDLTHAIPNSIRINRGKSSLDTVAEKALECEIEKIIIADRWKGGLGKVQLFEMGDTGLVQLHPIIYVKDVKLRREFRPARGKKVESLVFQAETEAPFEIQRLANSLSEFLNISKLSTDETPVSDRGTLIYISFSQANRIQLTFLQLPRRVEVGPRITVSHLIWRPWR